jgi:peroxiredoxin
MLAMAAREGWDLALFRAVMRARAEAGELGDALEVGGLIAVDPRTAPALADSIATVGRNRWGDSAWNAAVMAGRERLREFTMTKALDRQVRGAPVVEDSSGRDVSLAAQLGDREAVVVFWSRDCAPALEALPALDSMATHLARTGIPMVLVVDEKPSMEFRRFMESKGATVRVLHDVKGEAKLAYGNFGTPSTYVLDSRKRIRFANIGSATDLPVQLAALREERDRSERSLPPQSVTRR